jgi:hypothetical protein
METECEIAVDLRSDRVVYELHREASILRRVALGATPAPVEVSTTDLLFGNR